MGRGTEVSSRFSFSREREGSRDIFLFPPKERRVVAPKGLSNVLFYFGQDDATVQACFATWKIVCKVDDEEDRSDFYPFPSMPSVLRPFHHVSRYTNGNQPNINGCTNRYRQNNGCFWRISLVINVKKKKKTNEESHSAFIKFECN